MSANYSEIEDLLQQRAKLQTQFNLIPCDCAVYEEMLLKKILEYSDYVGELEYSKRIFISSDH